MSPLSCSVSRLRDATSAELKRQQGRVSFQSAVAPDIRNPTLTTSEAFIKTFGNVKQGLPLDFPLVQP